VRKSESLRAIAAGVEESRHLSGSTQQLVCKQACRQATAVNCMSRTYLTFGDIAGKLHILRVECTLCPRKGRYNVAKLVAQYGRRGNMSKWVSDLRGDSPKRNAAQLHQRCDLICPDLPKVI
jgi:hypothetical protein